MTVLAAPRFAAAAGLTPRSPRVRAVRPVLALASGGLLYAATPPVGWWPLAPLGVALLALAVRGTRLRTAYALGLLAGAALLVPLLAWARAPGIDLWLLLAAAESALFALLGPGLALVARLPAAPLWGSAVWVLDETVRDRWPFGGLAWSRLAFTQPASPFTRWAEVGGAPLVSAVVALAGLLLAAAVGPRAAHRSRPRFVRRLLRPWVPVVLGLATAASGALLALPAAHGAELPVAIVQGNVPRQGLDVFRQRQAVLADQVQQTLTLAAAVRAGRATRPQLVIWPEDADDIDPFTDRRAYDEITVAAAAVGAPVLLGAVLDAAPAGHLANTALLFTGTGYAGQQYVKRHPVPFGEYLPYRSVLQHLSGRASTLLPRDDVRGAAPGEFDVAGTTVGDVICFEVSDDGVVRDAVDHGGRLLVVQTNNASFGRGGETWQQLAMARLRAVEHGRTVLVSATSGVSAVVEPDGRVVEKSSLFTPAVLSADVRASDARTVADRVGAWPDRALTALGVCGLVLGLLGRTRRDGRPDRRRGGA